MIRDNSYNTFEVGLRIVNIVLMHFSTCSKICSCTSLTRQEQISFDSLSISVNEKGADSLEYSLRMPLD
jgi:hypothetical protein